MNLLLLHRYKSAFQQGCNWFGDAAEREEDADGAQRDIFRGSAIWTRRMEKKTLGFSWWGVWADLVLQQWLRRKKKKCLLVTNNDIVLVLCSGVANFTVHYLRCVNIKWHISEDNKESELDCWRKRQQQLSLPSVWDWMGSSWQCVCDNSVINCDKSAIITNLLPSAVIYIHIHLHYLHIQQEHHRFERETLSILP